MLLQISVQPSRFGDGFGRAALSGCCEAKVE